MVWLAEIGFIALAIVAIVLLVRAGRSSTRLHEIAEERIAAYVTTLRRKSDNPEFADMTDSELHDVLGAAMRRLAAGRNRKFVLLVLGAVGVTDHLHRVWASRMAGAPFRSHHGRGRASPFTASNACSSAPPRAPARSIRASISNGCGSTDRSFRLCGFALPKPERTRLCACLGLSRHDITEAVHAARSADPERHADNARNRFRSAQDQHARGSDDARGRCLRAARP